MVISKIIMEKIISIHYEEINPKREGTGFSCFHIQPTTKAVPSPYQEKINKEVTISMSYNELF